MSNTYGFGPTSVGYGGYGSPADQAARLAQAQLAEGSASTPIRSKWQGAARLANALMGGLGARQAMQGWQQGKQDLYGAGGGPSPQAAALAGAMTGGVPAAPGALADLENATADTPNMTDADFAGLKDSDIMGQGPQMGPPMPAMAPGNAAGGVNPGGPFPGGALPAGGAGGGVGSGSMLGMNAPPPQGIQVASNDPNFMPSFPSPSADKGQAATGQFNPADLAMFQQDEQAVPGKGSVAPQGGGSLGASTGAIVNHFTSNGYSPNGAAGIVGNFQQESGMNPGIVGDGGTSGGLGQWHGSRFAALQSYAQQLGTTWQDPRAQLAFADKEIRADPQLFQALNAARSPQEAADIFQNGFEHPAAATANTAGRERYAANALGGGDFLHNSVAGPGAPSDLGGGQPQSGAPGQATGAPGFDMDALRQVVMNPYADPADRQMAGQMLLQSRMPQVTWVDVPNSNTKIGVDRYGRPIPGMQIQGPHKTSVVDAGTDISGVKHQAIYDENTGQIRMIPMGGDQPQAGGSAPAASPSAPVGNQPAGNIPPPNPAWTPQPQAGAAPAAPPPQGQPQVSAGAPPQYPTQAAFDNKLAQQQQLWTQQLSAKYGADAGSQIAQLAKNYVNGSQGLPNGMAQAKPQEQLAWNLATQFDPTLKQTRFTTMQSFVPGSGGNDDKTINAGRTALAHSAGAVGSSAGLEAKQSNFPYGGSYYNEFIANPQQQGDAAEYNRKATTAYNEVNKAYVGGPGTADERALPPELEADAQPERRARGWAALGEQLQDKINKMQEGYHNGAGNVPDFPLMNADDQANLQRMENLGKWAKGGQPQAQAQPQGNDPLSQARAAIAKGAPRAAVIERLQKMGVNPAGL